MPKATLGKLVGTYLSGGPEAARHEFQRFAPRQESERLVVIHPADATLVTRTHTDEQRIGYLSFDAPADWHVPYAIEYATFARSSEPDQFMHHAGEELLMVLRGKINYVLVSKPNEAERLPQPLGPGKLVRVNCSLPHNAWTTSKSAEAWMIFRDIRETASAIATPFEQQRPSWGPRLLPLSAFERPAHWALAAWGIADQLRTERERSRLSLRQVAVSSDLDPSYLFRIESGDANVTIDALARVAGVLGVRLEETVAPSDWNYRIDDVGANTLRRRKVSQRPLTPPTVPHRLHGESVLLTKGVSWSVPDTDGAPESWIVLSGLITIESEARPPVTVHPGSVLHIRDNCPATFTTHQPSALLRIRYSERCACSPNHPNTPSGNSGDTSNPQYQL